VIGDFKFKGPIFLIAKYLITQFIENKIT